MNKGKRGKENGNSKEKEKTGISYRDYRII